MKVRHIALLLTVCLLAAGCRHDPYLDAHLELLNAAKRSAEDRVYDLEYEYELKVQEVERLRKENERLRKAGAGSTRAPSGGTDLAPPTIELPDIESPSQPVPEEDIDQLRPPTVDPGVPGEPTFELPASPPGRALAPPPTSNAPNPVLSAPTLALNDPHITQLVINRELTGGGDWEPSTGDEGLDVVFEPRDESGKFVPLAGPVSVVVLDPAEPGEQKRVARWDLEATEVDRQISRATNATGIRLKLPWPDKPPKSRRLHLFVRYTTVDGRQLQADEGITIDPPGQISQNWTPRSKPATVPDAPPEPPTDVARPEWKPFR